MRGGNGRGLRAIVLAMALGFVACGGGGGDSPGSNLPNPAPPADTEVVGLVGPEGLTFDSNGVLYVGSTTGRITRITPDGDVSVFVETGRSLAGLATGPQDEIWAAAFNSGEVLAITQNGVMRVATSGLDSPNAIVFDRFQRPLVSATGVGGRPQVALILPDTSYTTLTRSITTPNGMAFGKDGALYVADTLQNRVMRMEESDDATLTAPEIYASGVGFADGIAFDDNGDLFVTSAGQIWVVTPEEAPGARPFVTSGDLNGPASLAFGFGTDRDRARLYFTNYGWPVLGSGTTVASVKVGISGAKLYAP
jgi:sugar lactone lactonase YvrE